MQNFLNIKRYDYLISIYRKLLTAFGYQHWWPGDSPFEIAIGAILTQNTNWRNVEKAILNIKQANLLTVRRLYQLKDDDLALLIKPSGYYNVKTRRLKNFLGFIIDNYGGKVEYMSKENTYSIRKKLLSIKGIGQETADSILLYALNKSVFVIDGYTKRVLSRHLMVRSDISYDDCQLMFYNYFPKNRKLFNEFHALLVNVGKNFCRTIPKCGLCPLM